MRAKNQPRRKLPLKLRHPHLSRQLLRSRRGRLRATLTPSGEQLQPGIDAPAGVQSGSGKNPYKISPVTDIVIPVVLAVVFCGGFCATIKVVPDKVGVYGISDEDARYIVKDKALVVPTLLSDIACRCRRINS